MNLRLGKYVLVVALRRYVPPPPLTDHTAPQIGCTNCDDVQCMDCRTRTWHEECFWDCPFCSPVQT